MGASVQFYGIDQVMQASENRGCPCWGIWVNGGLFSKCEIADMGASMDLLRQNLDILEASNANTIYTLKFFECSEGRPVKINDKSVTDGGRFSFKLIEEGERQQGLMRVNGYSHEIHTMKQEIASLKAMREENDQETEPETLGTVMIDLLKNPQQLAQVVNIFRAALGQPVQNLAAIAGIPAASTEATTEEERLNRTAVVLDNLEKGDPQFLEHLEKLEKIKRENPDHYKILLGML